MMTDDELATECYSLIDHIFRDVCGQENGADVASCVAYLHSRVIPFFLGTPWRYRFYAIDNLPKEHLFCFLFFVFHGEIRDAGLDEDVVPLDKLADIRWIDAVAIPVGQHLVEPSL